MILHGQATTASVEKSFSMQRSLVEDWNFTASNIQHLC